MSKKMCKLYSLAEKDTKAYTKYVLPAKYVCKKCGRVANSDDLLCRPKELDIKKVKDQKDKSNEDHKKKKDKEKCDKKQKKDKASKSNKLKKSKIDKKEQIMKVNDQTEPIDVEAINKYIVKAASSEGSLEKKRVKVSKSQVLK